MLTCLDLSGEAGPSGSREKHTFLCPCWALPALKSLLLAFLGPQTSPHSLLARVGRGLKEKGQGRRQYTTTEGLCTPGVGLQWGRRRSLSPQRTHPTPSGCGRRLGPRARRPQGRGDHSNRLRSWGSPVSMVAEGTCWGAGLLQQGAHLSSAQPGGGKQTGIRAEAGGPPPPCAAESCSFSFPAKQRDGETDRRRLSRSCCGRSPLSPPLRPLGFLTQSWARTR